MRSANTLLALGGIFVAGVLLCAAGAPVEAQGEDRESLKVVESKEFTITLGDYESIAATQSPMHQKTLLEDPDKRMEFLEKIINMNLLAMEGKKRGLDKNPEVVTVRKNRLATLMHSVIADGFKDHEATEEEMREYYDRNIDKYNKPEKMRARHILIGDKGKAEELLSKLLKEDLSQYKFRRIAQESSEDEDTRNKGGDLGFFTVDGDEGGGERIDQRLAQAVFEIKENGTLHQGLVETDAGFHILMRTGHRNPMNLTFEEAKARLAKLVQREIHQRKTDEAISELKEKYNVRLFDENLKHVVIDLSKDAGKPTGTMGKPRSK